ncbi:OmpA family protein [cf. Phormidesmis sp. LEGE 11477]|uniref:OmpA family protein n=1 Tax=cf. Phormidesmis sp. LEGE 11477 TaxID=1828680 RepID=UPI0018805CEC|nr:OmpA family protein [cf. Phormidesmis sp. LEGE 11477]
MVDEPRRNRSDTQDATTRADFLTSPPSTAPSTEPFTAPTQTSSSSNPAGPVADNVGSSVGYPPGPGFDRLPAPEFSPVPDRRVPPEFSPEFGRELSPSVGSPLDGPVEPAPKLWQKQPYAAIAHLLAMGGILTAGWFFGILAAQVLPGNIQTPPLQESLLRKTSRLSSRLWHFRRLWQTPTTEVRIEAVPLPSSAPVTNPVTLTPIERQPLIDELNSIETEILTLERRIETLEQRLGAPAYAGADVDTRINTLRNAIDPPIRPEIESAYKPIPADPADALLEVASLKMTLPSDALFAPGQSSLIDDALLDQVLDQLVNYAESTVIVRSYSDDRSEAIAARDYTLAQANAIATYLQSALPMPHRWVTIGSGQAQPVATNDTPTKRQRNRRIEILVDTR